MLVTCEERVWDGKRCRIYNIGDQADIDPLSPLAKYFEGWPPGTEVYTKIKGVEGTRMVPGKSKEVSEGHMGEGTSKAKTKK